jgi:amino acid transporter
MTKKVHKLNQFFATAICGNDILSSALYVSGIAALFAGVFAPLVLLLVGFVLLLYRQVYREVVEALPVNGGAYNALLNSTSKIAASVAGTMTILSYIATVVISAKTAVEYLFYLFAKVGERMAFGANFDQLHHLVIPATIAVMLAFALLVIAGVKDSAKVAAGIFSFHLATLALFILGGGIYLIVHGAGGIGLANWQATQELMHSHGGLWHVLFLGFAVSLLGVSGFESSANFVEEQAPGVFSKTLRNMTAGVMIFNPLIAAVTLAILPLARIVAEKDFVLGAVGFHYGGIVMLALIGIDAFLVLCGAVLTGYVGVSGLINRMALDSVLPSFLLSKNSRGSFPRIVIIFFLLCTSILVLTRGNLLSLAGVYTISFLSVMTLFAIGNLILRRTRPELKRPYKASVVVVILAALATFVGLIGTIKVDNNNLIFFLGYFIPAILLVFSMIFKKDFYANMRRVFTFIPLRRFKNYFLRLERGVENAVYYVFLHHSENLFRALEYVHNNEGGYNITFVHCGRGDQGERKEIEGAIPVLKRAGVYPHFNIQFKYITDSFGPETIQKFARQYKIPLSRIFIGSIHSSHQFDYHEFGGVRIILE